MGDGRWEMGERRSEVGSRRWEMGDGRWESGVGKVEVGGRRSEVGDGRWKMGDGRREMGDGKVPQLSTLNYTSRQSPVMAQNWRTALGHVRSITLSRAFTPMARRFSGSVASARMARVKSSTSCDFVTNPLD